MKYKAHKKSKYEDQEKAHHTAKQKKSFANTKQYRILDNVLRSKDAYKILSLEEKY